MAKTELMGSWFNSGYHGHFRSKSRTDFLCEYRHLAKPAPPKTFLSRSKANVTRHAFSHHDNRNSFMNDALYFEQGLGRRRIKNNTNRYQRDLLDWHPELEEQTRGGPRMSVYKVDFHSVPVSETMRQKIIRRPKTSFDDDRISTTSYRYAHGVDNPNKQFLDARSNNGLSTVSNRKLKASFISGRESVASCLNWYVPKQKSYTSMSSNQTETVQVPAQFVPHPPSTEKTVATKTEETPVVAPMTATAPAVMQIDAV